MAYKSQNDVLVEMLSDHKELTGIELKPTDLNREEVIKMMPFAGAISHFYAELQRVKDDFYPQSSGEEALERHLEARQLPRRAEPQPSVGVIKHLGEPGGTILAGNQVRRRLDGRLFKARSTGVIGLLGYVEITYESLTTGADNNIDPLDEQFDLVTPIIGVEPTAVNTTPFRDARDLETPAEMLERIEVYDRGLDTGGNPQAYETWAREASPAVVGATTIKHARGPGTVDTVITSGTTNIEHAVENDMPVERIPSLELVNTVQQYIEAKNPTTDNHQTIAPIEEEFDTTVTYVLYNETLRALVDVEITKIWKIFVYQAKPGQRIDPTDLERRIDSKLGHLIDYRRVSDFTAGSPSYTVANDRILKPRTLTLLGAS